MLPECAPSTKLQTSNRKPQTVRSTVERLLPKFNKENAFVSANWRTTKGLSAIFSCYISLLVPSSYQYHIGDVPYIFHICSICVPYIFQYYIDLEYIWNTIGKWIDYLLFRSVMMATSSRVSGERNEFSVWSLKSLKGLKGLGFLLTTRSLIITFLA